MMTRPSIKIKKYHDSIVYDIGSLYSLLTQYFSEITRVHHLTPAKLNILFIVQSLGGRAGIPQGEIGDKLFVSAANITKIVDSLEKEGLVRRIPSKEDRRVKRIQTTPSARSLLETVWPGHVAGLNSCLHTFSDEEKARFSEYLKRLIQEVKNRPRQKPGISATKEG